MRKKQAYMYFGDYGWPFWEPVEYLELRLLLEGAEQLIANKPIHLVRLTVEQIMDTLIEEIVFEEDIDPRWRSTAIMVTAMRGLLGDKIPPVKHELI